MSPMIVFFGADGVGKTVQSRILATYIKKIKPVKIIRIRSGRTFASILYRFYKKFTPDLVNLGTDGRVIRIYPIAINSWNRKVWSLIELASMIPLLVFNIFIPLIFGTVIIAERYMIDAVATLGFLVGDPYFLDSLIAKAIMSFIPRSSVLIHLEAPYKTIVKRRKKMTDPKEYLEYQLAIYRYFAKKLRACSIDTSLFSIEDTAKVIKKYIIRKKCDEIFC